MKIVWWVCLLVGCANTPGNIDPAQLPTGTTACGTVAGIWGTGYTVLARLDEKAKIDGSVTTEATKDGCKVTVTTTQSTQQK